MREIFDVLLLIALGMGYIVLYFARREEKAFQVTGYFIGTVMITLVAFYSIANLLIQNRMAESKDHFYRRMMQQKMMQQGPGPAQQK